MHSSIDPRILHEALEDGLDDWVFLGEVRDYLSRFLGFAEDDLWPSLRRLVKAFIDDGLFEAGTYDSNGFELVRGPVDPLLDDLAAQPWTFEHCHYALALNLTRYGEAVARRRFAEEFGLSHEIDQRILFDVFRDGSHVWLTPVTVAGHVTRQLQPPEDQVCTELRNTIRALVGEGILVAGELEEPAGFRPLRRPLEDHLDEMCNGSPDCRHNNSDPLLWLRLTEHGAAEAKRMFPHAFDPDWDDSHLD